ncbi:MAG: metallophosphoesterase [Pirellulales bacterium]
MFDPSPTSRRDALKTAALAAAACALPALARGAEPAATRQPRKRALRLAHLTDVHVQPELAAGRGFAAALHAVQQLDDKPQLILGGGDAVMDSFGADEARTRLQWDLWKKVLAGECSLPSKHCLGNHDVWGWDKKESKCTGEEPLYGKRWALEALGLERPYYSFDQAGWHIVALDSTQSDGKGGYVARLDEPQYDWLVRDLAAVPRTTPVLLLSHIPLLTVTSFMELKPNEAGDWVVPGGWMHQDFVRLAALFRQHPNVRLCLSGHMHQVDRVDFQGVTYLCSGAVCGDWWKGAYHDCPAGFAVIDLFDDGTHASEYVNYGWKPVDA